MDIFPMGNIVIDKSCNPSYLPDREYADDTCLSDRLGSRYPHGIYSGQTDDPAGQDNGRPRGPRSCTDAGRTISMSDRSLTIWWDDVITGTLSQDRHGDLGFVYAVEWLERGRRPLSRSLPLRAESFSRAECRPFFGGLLPEADQRDRAAGALGVSPANDFALLDGLGGDVAGALMLIPEGQRPPERSISYNPTALSEGELAEILALLPRRPLLAGQEGLRLSLAGAQVKIPVVLIDGAPALPSPGQPTTHIIKPEIERFRGSVDNEAWCMALAAAIGLPVAPATARMARDRPYLLVERYDRMANADGTTARVHQEDACQALGIPSERKYAAEGGPSFLDLFGLVRDYVRQPASAVLNILDVAIFNFAIGNADAHGKNFSFLLEDKGPRFAPFYDLLSTTYWPDLSHRMAMRLGGAGGVDEANPKTWKAFAETAGVTERLLRQRVDRVLPAIVSAIDRLSKLDIVTKQIASDTRLRVGRIRQSL
jgi:serine/threonine-protein kinase HipA